MKHRPVESKSPTRTHIHSNFLENEGRHKYSNIKNNFQTQKLSREKSFEKRHTTANKRLAKYFDVYNDGLYTFSKLDIRTLKVWFNREMNVNLKMWAWKVWKKSDSRVIETFVSRLFREEGGRVNLCHRSFCSRIFMSHRKKCKFSSPFTNKSRQNSLW